MKKLTLLLLSVALFMSGVSFGQKTTYFKESFTSFGANIGKNWDIQGSDDGYKSVYTADANSAGGTAPEACFAYDPGAGLSDKINGTLRLISKGFVTTGKTKNYVTFKTMYEAAGACKEGERSFGVLARKEGSTTWKECRKVSGLPIGIDPMVFTAELPGELGNSSTKVQIALFIQNTNHQIPFYWFFDDVEFYSIAEGDYDATIDITSPLYATEELKLSYNITNKALPMDSCVVSYSLNSEDVKNNVVKFQDTLLPSEVFKINDFNIEGWSSADYGAQDLKIWISKINDKVLEEGDIRVLEKQVYKANETDLVAKRPMIEQFTSSTCGPCATYNKGFLNDLYDEFDEKISLVKYQMNWPTSGDPYYTAEGGVRRDFYGVNSVPSLFMGGRNVDLGIYNSYTKMKAFIEKAVAEKAYFSINIDTAGIDNTNKVHIAYSISTKGFLEGATLHTIVVENTTEKNVGNNGETEFHNVMLKMLPNASGMPVSLEADSTYKFSFVVDMKNTKMEEFNDLSVVCFLQGNDKTMIQSATKEVGRYGTGLAAQVEVAYLPTYVGSEDIPLGLKIIGAGDKASTVEVSAKVDDGGTVVTNTFDVDLEWGDIQYVVFDGLKVQQDGSHKAILSASKINGQTVAQAIETKNDFIAKKSSIELKSFIEVFTSSRDDDSKNLNEEIVPLYTTNRDNLVFSRFPVGTDPYKKKDNESYMEKAGLFSIPSALFNGIPVSLEDDGGLEGDYLEKMINSCKKNNSVVNITAKDVQIAKGSSTTVSGLINIESEISPLKGKLHVYLVERTTKNNTGTTGETEFIQVVHNILPSYSGIELNVRDSYEYNLKKVIIASQNKIENYENLVLVVTYKSVTTGEVYQTAEFPVAFLLANEAQTEYNNLVIYPNPTSDYTNLSSLENATIEVYSLNGHKLFSKANISGDYSLDMSSYSKGQYIIKVKEGNKISSAKITVVR